MAHYTHNAPDAPAMPVGYTIDPIGEYQPGKNKLAVRLNGTPTDMFMGGECWHMEEKDAIASAWCDYYGRIAEKRNATRKDERNHVLAWKLPDDTVYTYGHLDHFVPEFDHMHVFLHFKDKKFDTDFWVSLDTIEQLGGIVSAFEEILLKDMQLDMEAIDRIERQVVHEVTINRYPHDCANFLCQHCGTGACDDELLYKHRQFHEGWNYDGFYDELDDEEPEEEIYLYDGD